MASLWPTFYRRRESWPPEEEEVASGGQAESLRP
jgi:hypothetical protein